MNRPIPPLPCNVREALRHGSELLARAGVDSARLDMSLILARALGVERWRVLAESGRELTADEAARAHAMLERRLVREPLAYILGEREFFGLAFEVNPAVLIPRPETEHLVESAIEWLETERERRHEPWLVDIGTGSGAIAVAVAHRCPWTRWIATDISEGALATARRNAERHGVADRIDFRAGSLLEPIDRPVDAICSNPPYVDPADRTQLAPEVADWEPATALFSPDAGLQHLFELVESAPALLRRGGVLLMECGAGQAPAVLDRLRGLPDYAACDAIRDLAGIERVVRAVRR